MIKVSLRLKAIAELINDGSKVIDVGCDHGLLDIFLAQSKNCTCLATDISATCLEKAKENIKKYNLDEKVTTKVTNGLTDIEYKDYDYVVISGMGFGTIKNILANKNPEKIIIQSNNNLEDLRRYLLKKYILVKEIVVLENGIYYAVMSLKKGNKKYNYADYLIGLNKGNNEYVNYLYKKYKNICCKMPNKYLLKKIIIYRKLLILRKYKKSINLK